MAAFRVGPLPEDALEASSSFHSGVLPKVLAELGRDDLVLVFAPAPYDHRGWRLAAVQSLARVAAPVRVNGVVGDDEAALAETLAFLEGAPGVTGQLIAVDGKPAENR